jgi:hypothetical protein
MLRVFDFRCPNGHKWEAFLPSGQQESICQVCGSNGEKQLSAPRSVLDGVSGHFPGELLKWEKRHR